METNLYLNTIQLSIRANKFSYGDRMLDEIRSNRTYVIIIATNAGQSSKKKITDKCKTYNVPYFVCLTKEELFNLFHKEISSFGINDKNLAKKLIENLNKGGFYYESKK